ncbi:methyl-accepting chemotaxis protein, partial [Azohydromonas lata]
MKNSEFVTGQEFVLRQGMTLMSTTDATSRITYANSAFVEASGFDADELVGQPHNLVRHPDMPPAAFADMWATLKAGLSWTGMVKNRRKNGDHYWVVANATPMRRNGQLAGYMSVRTPATPAQAQAAQRLYDDMRAGRLKGRALHRGLLVRSGLTRALSFFQLASLRTRLALGAGVASAAVALPALAMASTLAQQLTVAGSWAAGLLLGGGLLWRQVATPVDAVLAHANEVASGETSPGPAMNRVDEIGLLMRAVNQAGLNLGALVDDVSVQVHAMASATGQIASGSQDLSGRTEQAASSLQQTAAAMEQIAQTVQNNATNSLEVRKHAESATEAATEGGQAMQRLVAQMDGIQRHGTRIADIAGLID